MLDLIVIAGCAGGVAGFIFGIVVERTRKQLIAHERELHSEHVRATALARESASHAPAPAYQNGAASHVDA